jgi:hypothetical protein
MKNKRGKQMMTVKRKTDAVARVIDRLAELKFNKPRPQKSSRPKTRQTRKSMQNSNKSSSNVQLPFQASTGNRKGMMGMKSKRVPFREELGSINGSTGFVTNAYNINPGQAGTFPWLAVEAKQWEKYRFLKLKFVYTPQVTEFSTSGVGSLVMGFDSDASDPPPNDLTHALNCTPRSFNLPCKNIVLDIPQNYLNRLNDGFYVRPGNLPGQSDIKDYDCGIVNISTIANAGTGALGILAVEYVCEFFIPILEAIVGAPANNSVALFQSTTPEASGSTGVDKTIALATASFNGIGAVNTAGSIVLPQGNYLVDVTVNSTNSNYLENIDLAIDITYGGTSVFKTRPLSTSPDSGIASIVTYATQSASVFIQANGTNAILVIANCTYTGGTSTTSGICRITAI